MIISLVVFYTFNLTDLVMTLYGIYNGYCAEVNPLAGLLLARPWLFVAVKLLVPALICVYLYKNKTSRLAKITGSICCCSYAVLFAWNSAMLLITK